MPDVHCCGTCTRFAVCKINFRHPCELPPGACDCRRRFEYGQCMAEDCGEYVNTNLPGQMKLFEGKKS